MLQLLQENQGKLNAQQEAVLQQLLNKHRCVQYQQQQLRLQQQQRAQQGTAAGMPSQQLAANGGQMTPQAGTAAQTGFVMDNGSNCPATGHAQTAGMPGKSANVPNTQMNYMTNSPGLNHQISSTTNQSSDSGELSYILHMLQVQKSPRVKRLSDP